MGRKAYLVLENGKVFEGEYFAAEGEVTAEVVFTTGMTGYLETLTDRSYYGQIAVQTFPLIGNYGVISSDFESDVIGPRAYIVKDWCQAPSNFRSEGRLDTFLKDRGIIGIKGIDTRTLTKTIREKGVMNGTITDNPQKVDFEKMKAYRVTDAISSMSTKEILHVGADNAKYTIALMDYGRKRNIERELTRRNAKVIICPHDTTAKQIKALGVDGIMLSNGPGDPSENKQVIKNLKEIMDVGIPMFGICLGHQLMGLAHGGKTFKMPFGHHGMNHPVREVKTGKVSITSQNHGFNVDPDSLPNDVVPTHWNLNDGTLEGMESTSVPAFSVQYHPETAPGTWDAHDLFPQFRRLILDAGK